MNVATKPTYLGSGNVCQPKCLQYAKSVLLGEKLVCGSALKPSWHFTHFGKNVTPCHFLTLTVTLLCAKLHTIFIRHPASHQLNYCPAF